MNDTIAAIATPPGKGGIGIIRISGPNTLKIARIVLGSQPKQRLAIFSNFSNASGEIIDQGVAIFFKSPHSFTGEDVLELQGHGGSVIMDRLLKTVIEQGARVAQPGEFSQRAFLNGKIDLSQAEAVSDLINASSEEAAKSAVRSLQGAFSERIHSLLQKLTHLRMLIEAAIDFSEEEIDFIDTLSIRKELKELLAQIGEVKKGTRQGVLLQEGLQIVIAGEPNTGKSSLLNKLTNRESAIVTDIPGTTRDVIRESIQIDGLPVHIVDTAGIRSTSNAIEQEGIRRAKEVISTADLVLLMQDATRPNEVPIYFDKPTIIIQNKIDLLVEKSSSKEIESGFLIRLSVKTEDGLDLLKYHVKQFAGYRAEEGQFIARRRHIDALVRCEEFILKTLQQVEVRAGFELLAEELLWAQNSLSEITGKFTNEDLLDRIFMTFCIGK